METFSLVGTLSSESGQYAFFSGSDSSFKKALQKKGEIVGFIIKDIEQSHVKMELDGKEIMLKVGAKMRRQDEGEWNLVADSEPAASRSSSESEEAPSSAEEDEILKKLMQKREQELKK